MLLDILFTIVCGVLVGIVLIIIDLYFSDKDWNIL